jgi:hypothetical protein
MPFAETRAEHSLGISLADPGAASKASQTAEPVVTPVSQSGAQSQPKTKSQATPAAKPQQPQAAPAESSPRSPNPSGRSTGSTGFTDNRWWRVILLLPIGFIAALVYRWSRSRQLNAHLKHTQPEPSLPVTQQPAVGQTDPAVLTQVVTIPVNGTEVSTGASTGATGVTSPTRTAGATNISGGSSQTEPVLQPQPEPVTPVTPETALIPTQPIPTLQTPTTKLAKVDIVEALVDDLHSPDSSKRRKAVWELGQRGDSRAVQPLVDLLVDADSQQRSLILAALSEISTRTLKPMNRALMLSLQDDNADVRKNAIRDVTRIYDLMTQVSQLLQYATSDGDEEVQETARWALGQLNRVRTPDQLPSDSRSDKI